MTDGDGVTSDANDVVGALVDDLFSDGDIGALVVERFTTASYFDATGKLVYAAPGEPRLDHDPVTHAPLGLLVEGATSNAANHSEQLDDGTQWFNNGNMTVTANAMQAPDGATSAEMLVDSETAIDARRAQTYAVANDMLLRVCSGFVKAGSVNRISFGCELLNGTTQIQSRMTVDLLQGQITTAPPGAFAHGLEPVGNGWYRLWLSIQNNGTGNTVGVLSFWSENGNEAATGTYYAWGAQYEPGEFPTSYFPNASAAATVVRDADNVHLDVTAAEIATGAVRVVARPAYDQTVAAACVVGASLERICVDRDAATDAMKIDVVGTGSLGLPHGSWGPGMTRWGGFSYDAGSVEAIADDGPTGGTNEMTSAPTQVVLGSDAINGGVIHIQRVTVWSSKQDTAVLAGVSP